jgi:hypothetical protein
VFRRGLRRSALEDSPTSAQRRLLSETIRAHVTKSAMYGPAAISATGSLCDRAETNHQPIHRQRDPNRVGNVETHRPQLDHDATVDKHGSLHTMRLRVVKPNNITSPQLASCDLVHRHAPSV